VVDTPGLIHSEFKDMNAIEKNRKSWLITDIINYNLNGLNFLGFCQWFT
jgi:hypothetical protein